MVTCAVVAAFNEQSPHKSVQKRSAELGVLHVTVFDHKRDLVMKSFWLLFVIELTNADRLFHKACALLLE
jgi:DNA gyrase inhibitor GyrI